MTSRAPRWRRVSRKGSISEVCFIRSDLNHDWDDDFSIVNGMEAKRQFSDRRDRFHHFILVSAVDGDCLRLEEVTYLLPVFTGNELATEPWLIDDRQRQYSDGCICVPQFPLFRHSCTFHVRIPHSDGEAGPQRACRWGPAYLPAVQLVEFSDVSHYLLEACARRPVFYYGVSMNIELDQDLFVAKCIIFRELVHLVRDVQISGCVDHL